MGGAQRLLPAHVLNEYCHPSRSFNPCPDFKTGPLPRTRQTDEGEWFTTSYNGGKLGEKFAVCRGASTKALACYNIWVGGVTTYVMQDRQACHTLLSTRSQQRDELLARYSDRQKANASPF